MAEEKKFVKKVTPENIERAKALKAVGMTNYQIGEELGCDERTIRRWLQRPDPEGLEDKIATLREEHMKRYVDEAWSIVFQLNAIIRKKLEKGEAAFANIKDAATTMGIYFDKIAGLEARAKGGVKEGAQVNINILPPQDGHSTRVVADPIQVYDESGEVLSDDSGGRQWENILPLPAGNPDGPGVSEESWDNSSLDVSEPERLHSSDADSGTLGPDGAA